MDKKGIPLVKLCKAKFVRLRDVELSSTQGTKVPQSLTKVRDSSPKMQS